MSLWQPTCCASAPGWINSYCEPGMFDTLTSVPFVFLCILIGTITNGGMQWACALSSCISSRPHRLPLFLLLRVYYACQQDWRIPFTRLRRKNHTSAAAGAHGYTPLTLKHTLCRVRAGLSGCSGHLFSHTRSTIVWEDNYLGDNCIYRLSMYCCSEKDTPNSMLFDYLDRLQAKKMSVHIILPFKNPLDYK